MNYLNCSIKFFNKTYLKLSFTVLAIFCCTFLQAQTKPVKKTVVAAQIKPVAATTNKVAASQPATATTVNKPPTARNMADYRKTPQGIARAKKHAKATGAALTKHINYGDGTGATVTIVKNPAFVPGTTLKNKSHHSDKNDSTAKGGAKWVCSTNHVQLDANSTSFLTNDYSASISHIYPGAIFTFDAITSGTYNEQVGARNPIMISTDNPNIKGTGYVTVNDPNMATVRAGVDQLFRESVGPAATESQAYQIFQDYNSAATNLSIYGFASYAGASASDAYSNSNSSNSITLTIDERKSLFTINTIPPDSGFFKNSSLEDDPNLMMIGNVSYGIRVLANITVTFNSSQEQDNFKAAYSGFGVDANAAVNYLSTNKSVQSTINCYVVGGPSSLTTISFDKKDLESQLKKIIAGVNYQNARPISYQFYDMAGNVIGAQSATDQFAEHTCVPASTAGAKLKSVDATFANETGKRGDDHYHMFVYANDAMSIANGGQQSDNYNGGNQGTSENAPDDACLYYYYTYATNVDYQAGQNSNIQLTVSPHQDQPNMTLGYLMDHGGVVHLHIFPNGSDTWTIRELTLTLNFGDGAPPETIKWNNITLAQYSTEATLYFGSNFAAKN